LAKWSNPFPQGDITGTDIIFIVAGGLHSMALEATETMWTWGFGASGQLVHNNQEDRLVLTAMAREAFNRHKVVSVAAGRVHSVAVRMEGELWVWGFGLQGQLGLGDHRNQIKPTMIGTETALGESHVITASCAYIFTPWPRRRMEPYGHLAGENLAHWVTTIATLDLCQRELRHNTLATQRAQSTLFTWGIGDESKGIGNASRMPMWIPTRVDLGLMLGARIGPCHNLQPMQAMAFAMGSHTRLGGYNNPTDTVVGDSNKNKDTATIRQDAR